MKTDIWKAAKLLLVQLLKLDINEQLSREVDYLKAENQVLKNQLTKSGKRLKFTNEQRRLLAVKAKALGETLNNLSKNHSFKMQEGETRIFSIINIKLIYRRLNRTYKQEMVQNGTFLGIFRRKMVQHSTF